MSLYTQLFLQVKVFVAFRFTFNKQITALCGRNKRYGKLFGYHEIKIKIATVDFFFMKKIKFAAVDLAIN